MRRRAILHVLRSAFGPVPGAANLLASWYPVLLAAVAAVAGVLGVRDPVSASYSRTFWVALCLIIVAGSFARAAYVEYLAHHRPFPASSFDIRPLGYVEGRHYETDARFLLFRVRITNQQARRMILDVSLKMLWLRFEQLLDVPVSEDHGNLNPQAMLKSPLTVEGDDMLTGELCFAWDFGDSSFGIVFDSEGGFEADRGSRFAFTFVDHISGQQHIEYVPTQPASG